MMFHVLYTVAFITIFVLNRREAVFQERGHYPLKNEFLYMDGQKVSRYDPQRAKADTFVKDDDAVSEGRPVFAYCPNARRARLFRDVRSIFGMVISYGYLDDDRPTKPGSFRYHGRFHGWNGPYSTVRFDFKCLSDEIISIWEYHDHGDDNICRIYKSTMMWSPFWEMIPLGLDIALVIVVTLLSAILLDIKLGLEYLFSSPEGIIGTLLVAILIAIILNRFFKYW